MVRVLVAVDGSDDAREAARSLAFFAPAEEYIVLHAVNVPSMPYYTQFDQTLSAEIDATLRKDGEALVHEIASIQLVGLGYEGHGRVTVGIPALAIAQHAAETHADMILMGSHGRRGLTRYS